MASVEMRRTCWSTAAVAGSSSSLNAAVSGTSVSTARRTQPAGTCSDASGGDASDEADRRCHPTTGFAAVSARSVRLLPGADYHAAVKDRGGATVAEVPEPVTGVVVPGTGGVRSTSALGRAVVADALRAVDPVGARGAESATVWRRDYVLHFRRLVEAGLLSPDAALGIARDGLASLHARMRFADAENDRPLVEAFTVDPAGEPLATATVTGRGTAQRELVLPYHGGRLRGAELSRQLDRWVAAGVVEPSCAEAVRLVAENPDWLDLSDRRVAVLGAGAEMGPLTALMRWGAEAVAVDLPRPALWQRLVDTANRYGGRLRVPVAGDPTGPDLARRAGADLVHEPGRIATWLASFDGPLVLGNYVYADGAMNLRVAMAVDALTGHLLARRTDLALAFLATPTDVFAVPADAVDGATRRYVEASGIGRIRRPLRC